MKEASRRKPPLGGFCSECDTTFVATVVDTVQLDEAAFRGHVVRPGDPDYDVQRKIWNGSFDKHPALIIRCAGVADVIEYQTGARNAYAESHGSRVAPSVSSATVPAEPSSGCAFAQSSFAGGGADSLNVHVSCVGAPLYQSSRAMR
jgi:hypothetical protein